MLVVSVVDAEDVVAGIDIVALVGLVGIGAVGEVVVIARR
jgi:hypothetical protein